MKYLVFGAGENGRLVKNYIDNFMKNDSFVGFIDNSVEEEKDGVYPPRLINSIQFDRIIISNARRKHINDIQLQLDSFSVEHEKRIVLIDDKDLLYNIFKDYNRYDENTDSRVRWVHSFARYVHDENIQGNIAECGVNRGEFACYMNKYFPDRMLYLFDTFEGFDQRDWEIEKKKKTKITKKTIIDGTDNFKTTNEKIVMHKMQNPEKCIVKKGYFPDSAKDVEDNFSFVNLDMDLYAPMKAALEFFYKRMNRGG